MTALEFTPVEVPAENSNPFTGPLGGLTVGGKALSVVYPLLTAKEGETNGECVRRTISRVRTYLTNAGDDYRRSVDDDRPVTVRMTTGDATDAGVPITFWVTEKKKARGEADGATSA